MGRGALRPVAYDRNCDRAKGVPNREAAVSIRDVWRSRLVAEASSARVRSLGDAPSGLDHMAGVGCKVSAALTLRFVESGHV
jgi:hypothetical protein